MTDTDALRAELVQAQASRDHWVRLCHDSERASMSVLRSTAQDLKIAANALDLAAARLKDAGKGWQASEAKQAATVAHEAANMLMKG